MNNLSFTDFFKNIVFDMNYPFMSLKNMRNEILILKNYNRYKTIEKQIIKQYIKQLVVSNVR